MYKNNNLLNILLYDCLVYITLLVFFTFGQEPLYNIHSLCCSEENNMAFEKDGYVLHTREVQLKGGRNQKIYFFCKAGNKPKSGKPCDMPDGYTTGVNKRTKLPYLKKK
jgi:hypothetical protein